MYALSVRRNPRVRTPSFVDYFLASVRLIHGITAVLPGVLLMAFLPLDMPNAGAPFSAFLVFFGILSIVIFQTLGIYSEEIFSTLLRFRSMLLAWAAAFTLLIFMHQGMGLLDYLEPSHLAFWFATSMVLFGAERLLMLSIFRRLMSRGMFLQNAVILGGTDNGVRVAEYLQHRTRRAACRRRRRQSRSGSRQPAHRASPGAHRPVPRSPGRRCPSQARAAP